MTLVSSVVVVTPALSAGAVVPSQAITTTGPLTSIVLGNELSCQVLYQGDAAYEFFPSTIAPADCATLLVVDGTLYAPDFANHGGTATSALGGYTPFTPQGPQISTASSVTTTVGAGESGITIVQTDQYVVGQESYRTDIQVQNNSGSQKTVRVFRAGDCFLGGSDTGFGYQDLSTGTVGCRTSLEAGSRLLAWVPISPGSTYYEDFYNDVWAWIGGIEHPLFPNSCDCGETAHDNGAGISWEVTIPIGGSVTLSHLTSFSPAGTLPLSTSKTADSSTSSPAGQNGYTITVSNPNTTDVAIDTIVDTLPPGFSYVLGSSAVDGEVVITDPTQDGQVLTWSAPFTVTAGQFRSLHFSVTVADTPGEYFNEASATAGSYSVAPTGPTAPITVEDENQPPTAVDDEAVTAQNTPVNIDVLDNDSDPDEDSLTITNLTLPANGNAVVGVVGENQVVTYTPNAGFSGTDSFTYIANDGEVDSNIATVTVNVGQADSCTNTGAGCTLVTDGGTTGPGNPVSVQMTVPAGAPPGLYTIREIPDPVANSKGAAEYTAPDGDTILTITVSCDESQCKKKKLAILDKIVIVIKGNPDGSQQILPPCDLTIRIGRRVFHITNPPPCLDSVVRNGNSGANPGDLVWRVDVLGGDPTIKGRG